MYKPKTNSTLLDFARAMRHQPATAERLLWNSVNNRKLGGMKFRRQVPIGGYIADFLCYELKLIIELDGETHSNKAYDQKRDIILADLGFKVIRFANTEVYENLNGILETILLLQTNPHPRPLPRGEGARPCLNRDVSDSINGVPSPFGRGLG